MADPFILLDDARAAGASDARLYRDPVELVVARRMAEVGPALDRIAALAGQGHDMAGYLAYEAGLALEPRLAPLAGERTGAAGPLVWFGAFRGYETIAAGEVPQWLAGERLAAHAGAAQGSIGPMEPQLSPGGYARAFAALQEAIRAGDIYQANLTFPLAGEWHGDPLALYAAIRPSAAAGYGGIVHDGSHWLLSFSPELFFALREGAATVKPMKGTRPRSREPREDAALAEELAVSVKDRAENLMIVDLVRNDLSRVAEPGSVRTENLFAVETYPTVHTMVSTVRARLQPGKGAIDMIRALFPCGSITGAPKIRAMELIHRTERDARGPYCGAIGRIDASGDAAFNVAIRTLRLSAAPNGGGGQAVLGVGSAIVADSEGLAEWRECLVKGGFVRETAASFDLLETMAFTPDAGIPLIELHLERIRASAAELGFTFDRHAVRNAIQALCFDAEKPGKLRLMVAKSGLHSLELLEMPAALPQPVVCAVLRLPVDAGDWRLRHKNTDRGFYETAFGVAKGAGAGEALFVRDDGLVTEGSFTNVFVERGGRLLTPAARLGLLPGVLRRSLIEAGRCEEAELTLDDLAEGFLIGNAVRGLMSAENHDMTRPFPTNSAATSEALGRIAPSQTTAMTDRATALKGEGRDVISLSVGEPDFATPAHVIEAAKAAMDAGATKYTPVGGTARMKAAAALHFARDLGIEVPVSQVTISAGGKQAIFHALMATLNPGDEALIPAPWWVSYPEIVRFAGAEVVPLPTDAAGGFRITAGQLAAAITPRTRWLLLNSPGNPTGATYPAEELRAIGEVLAAHPSILVMSDDIYAPIRYNGAAHATLAAECPDLADRVLTVSGVSKSHAMTGFRIGVATGPQWLIRAMEKLQSHSSGNPSSVSQAAAVAAFEGPQDFLLGWREIFRARRDLVVNAINAIPGLATRVPDGAFYCMVDAAPLMGRFGDDEALAFHLLDHGVAIVQASAFGGRDGFRISFAADEAQLAEAVRRIAAAVA